MIYLAWDWQLASPFHRQSATVPARPHPDPLPLVLPLNSPGGSGTEPV